MFLIFFTTERYAHAFFHALSRILRAYKVPPGKVLIIGAGVAGLSAIATVCPSEPNLRRGEKQTKLMIGASTWCHCPRF